MDYDKTSIRIGQSRSLPCWLWLPILQNVICRDRSDALNPVFTFYYTITVLETVVLARVVDQQVRLEARVKVLCTKALVPRFLMTIDLFITTAMLLWHCYYLMITNYYIGYYYVLLVFLLLHCNYINIAYYYKTGFMYIYNLRNITL